VLFGLAVVMVPICFAFSSTRLARFVAYPAGSEAALKLSQVDVPERQFTRNDYSSDQSGIGFTVEGDPAPGTLVVVEGARFRLAAPDGLSYESELLRENLAFTHEQKNQPLGFSVPRQVADRIAAKGASVSAELMIAVYRLNAPQRIDTRGHSFEIPGVGPCLWDERFGIPSQSHYLNCRTALRIPDVYTVEIDSGENTCAQYSHEPPLPVGHRAYGVSFDNNGLLIEFDPNPIRTFIPGNPLGPWQPEILALANEDGTLGRSNNGNNVRGVNICPGTPFVFRTGKFVRRMRMNVQLGNLGKEERSKPPEGMTVFSPQFK
jgi:hypothetical protein